MIKELGFLLTLIKLSGETGNKIINFPLKHKKTALDIINNIIELINE